MANLVPDDVINAARDGATDVVRHWLESGGDPNWNLVDPNSHHFPRSYRLLMFTAEHDQRDVMKVLIAHGADVHYLYRYESWAMRALDVAIYGDKNEAARLLIENGASASRPSSDAWYSALGNHQLLRIVLAAGADFTALCCLGQTPEARARLRLSSLMGGSMNCRIAIYKETVSILEGARLAGSYKQYILLEFKQLLRIRSLLARGRARIGPGASEAVARLFGGRADETRRHARARGTRSLPQRPAGVPDPVFWKVMEYWRLGDWRRPWLCA